MYSVYKHTAPCGKVYIGITSRTPEKRWGGGANYAKQMHFYNAIRLYGWENIKHEILFTGLTKKEAEAKEVELIAEYKADNREFGYNIDHGGNAPGKLSDETKRKISNSKKGKPARNKGITQVAWNKGVPLTEEQRNKMSEALKGRASPFKGKHHSEETKKQCSEKRKGKMTGREHPRARKVKCIELNRIYDTLADAAKDTNISSASICHCCKGKTETAGGFHWMYIISAATEEDVVSED